MGCLLYQMLVSGVCVPVIRLYISQLWPWHMFVNLRIGRNGLFSVPDVKRGACVYVPVMPLYIRQLWPRHILIDTTVVVKAPPSYSIGCRQI